MGGKAWWTATGLCLLVGLLPACPDQGPPCQAVPTTAPAKIFDVEAPATVSAGSTFSLVPWVYLQALNCGDQPYGEPQSGSFLASLGSGSVVTLSGSVTSTNCAGACTVQGGLAPTGATVDVKASLGEGTYSIGIAPGEFEGEAPSAPPPGWCLPFQGCSEVWQGFPAPAATRTLEVE